MQLVVTSFLGSTTSITALPRYYYTPSVFIFYFLFDEDGMSYEDSSRGALCSV